MPTELARDLRQRDLVPPAALAGCTVLIVGVGAIGRQVALQLAAMGAPKLILFDDDHVAIENLAVQGFREQDLGMPKVQAVAGACQESNPTISINPLTERFRRSSIPNLEQILDPASPLAVFCCVDSMAARRAVFESLRSRARFFADGRMAGEVLRVLSSSHPGSEQDYPKTLFNDQQAHPAPCTARSTLYAASIAAGLMICRFARHLRGQEASGDLLLNLAADELTVGGSQP